MMSSQLGDSKYPTREATSCHDDPDAHAQKQGWISQVNKACCFLGPDCSDWISLACCEEGGKNTHNLWNGPYTKAVDLNSLMTRR